MMYLFTKTKSANTKPSHSQSWINQFGPQKLHEMRNKCYKLTMDKAIMALQLKFERRVITDLKAAHERSNLELEERVQAVVGMKMGLLREISQLEKIVMRRETWLKFTQAESRFKTLEGGVMGNAISSDALEILSDTASDVTPVKLKIRLHHKRSHDDMA